MRDDIRKNAEQVLSLEPHEFGRQISGIQFTIRQLMAEVGCLEAELANARRPRWLRTLRAYFANEEPAR